jgi:hypothetical protein
LNFFFPVLTEHNAFSSVRFLSHLGPKIAAFQRTSKIIIEKAFSGKDLLRHPIPSKIHLNEIRTYTGNWLQLSKLFVFQN